MKKIIALICLVTQSLFAHEIDIAGPLVSRDKLILGPVLTPERVEIKESLSGETKIYLNLTTEDGNFERIRTPDFEVNCKLNVAKAKLATKYFEVRRSYIYEVESHIECGEVNILNFKKMSAEGEALKIFDIGARAVEKMNNLSILGFWRDRITFRFPSNGDYYSWGDVHVTKGYQWDVVGHELGHAIYDQADIGSMGGGRHRIDECYTGALALSEGWASFFSAWLSIKLDDSDAKFEYLVPRRAPIRFENIPADVCTGPKNEWRVTGFLWDLIDLAIDGEELNIKFQNLWKMTKGKRYSNITKLANSIISQGTDPILVNIIYKNNFIEDL